MSLRALQSSHLPFSPGNFIDNVQLGNAPGQLCHVRIPPDGRSPRQRLWDVARAGVPCPAALCVGLWALGYATWDLSCSCCARR